jgi:hypothetical protein
MLLALITTNGLKLTRAILPDVDHGGRWWSFEATFRFATSWDRG